jgi:hypothetical protein
MNRVLYVVVPFLLTLGAALWFLRVFDRRPATDESVPVSTEPRPAEPPSSLAQPEPSDEPPPDVPEITAPLRLMLIAEGPRSFVSWCLQVWSEERAIQWQAWFASPAAGATTHSPGLAALAQPPTVADLDDVHVLVLAAADPARFPPEFWARVAERVRAGRMGLLVVPDLLHGKALSDEPQLATVLPVAAKAVVPAQRGDPTLPGVFSAPKPLSITKDGALHPASRIVSYPGWSERIWTRYTRGKDAWATKFVNPVERVAPGAKVLVEVDSGSEKIPAIVASDGEGGRALWVGAMLELDWAPYYSGAGGKQRAAMALSWIAWLAPPR